MPEGPSIVLLKEAVQSFKRKKIIAVTGNTKQPKERLINQTIQDFRTWGKHFLICFSGFTVRIHLMMFGSYRINERRDRPPRLGMTFSRGELNFYACAVTFIDEPLDEVYDWRADVMNDSWSSALARKKIKQLPDTLVCDALMDQQIFSGVGNIIKNEVLFRIRLHPATRCGDLPPVVLSRLLKEARKYSFEFLDWKRAFVLKKNWQIYNKKICPRCDIPVIKKSWGKLKRRSFYCENCQQLY